jgi:large subunit ribosomal protein L32
MAVPKKKTSPSRQGMRRAHQKVSCIAMCLCKKCNEPKYPHHACLACGFFKGKQVIVPKSQKRAEKAADAESET